MNIIFRNAAVSSDAQIAILSVLLVILRLMPLKYENVKPLLVLFIEKGMKMYTESVLILNCLFHKFFRKTCYTDIREKCFSWVSSGWILGVSTSDLKECLLRLLSNDNLTLKPIPDSSNNNAYNVLFNTTDDCILYSEFEYNITENPENALERPLESFETNAVIYNMMHAWIESHLLNYYLKIEGGLVDDPCDFKIIIAFFDSLLKYKIKTRDEVKEMPLYDQFRTALKQLYETLTDRLKSSFDTRNKVSDMRYYQFILANEYDPMINTELRAHIGEEFFHCLDDIIKLEVSEDDCFEETETEYNMVGLKQNCVYMLAAYCRKQSCYTDEILKCILDWDLYRFTSNYECPLHCIRMLNDSNVERPPLGN